MAGELFPTCPSAGSCPVQETLQTSHGGHFAPLLRHRLCRSKRLECCALLARHLRVCDGFPNKVYGKKRAGNSFGSFGLWTAHRSARRARKSACPKTGLTIASGSAVPCFASTLNSPSGNHGPLCSFIGKHLRTRRPLWGDSLPPSRCPRVQAHPIEIGASPWVPDAFSPASFPRNGRPIPRSLQAARQTL
jgi:hypothetical protein